MTARITNPSNSGFWETIFDVIPYMVYVVDVSTYELVNVNAATRRNRGAKTGDTCHRAIYQRESPCSFCKLAELQKQEQLIGGNILFELYNDVDDRWYQVDETLLSWFDGRVVKHSIAVDITKLMEMQSALAEAHAMLALKNIKLENVSVTDSLTGLFNRRKLDSVLIGEQAKAERYDYPLSVVIIDIDRFKAVNDTYGHQAGDEVLRAVAGMLKINVRNADVVGRWGGEEFLIVCPHTDRNGAVSLAEHLRQSIEQLEMNVVGKRTASFGVAQLEAGELADVLIDRADSALYRAKAAGRNRVGV